MKFNFNDQKKTTTKIIIITDTTTTVVECRDHIYRAHLKEIMRKVVDDRQERERERERFTCW